VRKKLKRKGEIKTENSEPFQDFFLPGQRGILGRAVGGGWQEEKLKNVLSVTKDPAAIWGVHGEVNERVG